MAAPAGLLLAVTNLKQAVLLTGAQFEPSTTRLGLDLIFNEQALSGFAPDEVSGFHQGDLIMPVVGRIFGGLDFNNYFLALKEVPPGVAMTLAEVKKAGVPVFAYGSFITILINFLILAFIIFIMIKQMNRLKREEPAAPAAPPPTPEDIVLLREIRDSLKK